MQLIRFVKFGMVGAVGVLVDFSVTWLCKEQLGCNKYLSNTLGFCLAVLNNYLLNKYFTFHDRGAPDPGQLGKYFIISLIGLGISNVFIYLLQTYTRQNFYASKILVVLMVFIWNFWANSYFTFPE